MRRRKKTKRAFLIQIISQAARLTRSFMTYKTGSEQWDILMKQNKTDSRPAASSCKRTEPKVSGRDETLTLARKKDKQTKREIVTVAESEDIMFFGGHANEVEYHGRRIVNGNAVTDAN
ncbi:hypothetical protein BDV26DRAFT_93530 [Aspergillus bertholletiae]|uniref:Uncharacterized protein n=1 Tax=Aspergillus bertholletiae TaxID=1226010 RepID=A0A5N7BPP2_9EURO|nr:hypothetical protein BDV26DRAFT_93530 [Aspergillus bertholletiae]